MLGRRRRAAAALGQSIAAAAFAAASAAAAAPDVPVASFSGLLPGAELPAGWSPYGFEKIRQRTQYTLIEDEGRVVLRARAERSASGLIRRMRIDPHEYPILRWSWKISNTLPKADLTRKDGDDFPARLYVTFDFPKSKLSLAQRLKAELAELVHGQAVPLATLCYVWASKEPVGTIAPSAYTDRVRLIVVESGAGRVNSWAHFERNLARDFQAAFGTPAPAVTGFAVVADTDNTGAAVTTHFGDISLAKQQVNRDSRQPSP